MSSMDVVLGLLSQEGRFFLQRRAAEAAVLPGRWEFPGGKVEAGEEAEAALRRELMEEVGWVPTTCEALDIHVHAYPGGDVRLHPFLCACPPTGDGRPATGLAWGWFTLAEMRRLPLPEANGPILDALVRLGVPGPPAGS